MEPGEELATYVRAALGAVRRVREVRMFGGIGFMLNDNITVAASKRGLLVRVGKDGQAAALERPGSQPMVMKGRVMAGYVRVAPPLTPDAAREWVELAVAFVRTLPPKARTVKSARKRKNKRARK